MVTIPKDKDDAIIGDVGSVLDASGRFRLIEVDQVPARVRGLTDSGYAVSKFAPPQPTVVDMHQEQPPLANIEIGALMGDVSYDNVSETISTMQTIGAGDGASLGTRYYTLAGNQIAAEYLFQRLESYGLNVWYEDFLTPEGILLVNVVGEVPGKDQSAVYGVMAHFDTTSEAPGTAPGADDNATGIAASLEIARILAGYQLKHPVRIIFVNAEEVGILGSNVWARTANANDVPMEGVFNVDSVGSDRQGSLMILNSDAESAWMQDLLIEMNNAYGLGQEVMSRQNPGIVADDNMVREQGIEAVMIARELYGWSPYHHSSSDVMDFVSIDNVVSMTYVVLLSVASLVQ
jgi:Zn-dependent M28 family amino/carboxypeptidase